MNPAEEFDQLKKYFGAADDADKLSFEEFVSLPEDEVKSLISRVQNMKKKGRLSLLRQQAKSSLQQQESQVEERKCTIMFYSKRVISFEMVLKKTPSSLIQQIAETINNYKENFDFKKNQQFDPAGYVLRKGNSIIVDFSVIHPGEIYDFLIPDRIPAISGSEWKEAYLELFGVIFHPKEEMALFDDLTNHELSPAADLLIRALETLDGNHYQKYPTRTSTEQEFNLARNNPELNHPLKKAIYLIKKFRNRESLVDGFIFLLLYELGFFGDMLYPVGQADLPLRFGETDCSAIADFAIYDIISFYRMAIFEDKSLNNQMVNSEPQMLAEAIAAHQSNLAELGLEAKLGLNDAEGHQKASAAPVAISNKIYGIRVNGLTFSFYQIPVSDAILTAMATQIATTEKTKIPCRRDLDFLDEKNRLEIITIFDYLLKKLKEEGKQSKRRKSVKV